MAKSETNELTREEFVKKFSLKLDRLMRSNHISNRELANKVGCTPVTIGSYRNGSTIPDAYMLRRISKAIPCTVDALTIFC